MNEGVNVFMDVKYKYTSIRLLYNVLYSSNILSRSFFKHWESWNQKLDSFTKTAGKWIKNNTIISMISVCNNIDGYMLEQDRIPKIQYCISWV